MNHPNSNNNAHRKGGLCRRHGDIRWAIHILGGSAIMCIKSKYRCLTDMHIIRINRAYTPIEL